MNRTLSRLLVIGVISTMAYASLCANSAPFTYTESLQQRDGKFRNAVPREARGFAKTLAITWRVLTQKPDTTVPSAPIPVQQLSAEAVADIEVA